jgi:hypothetical protein
MYCKSDEPHGRPNNKDFNTHDQETLAQRVYQAFQGTALDEIALSTKMPSAFPSSLQLQEFWDLYFVHFDKVSLCVSLMKSMSWTEVERTALSNTAPPLDEPTGLPTLARRGRYHRWGELRKNS